MVGSRAKRVVRSGQVDVLLERDGRLYPIEIKLTTKPAKRDTRGISAFRETYSKLDIAPGLVICPCERSRKLNDHDHSLPWDSQ